MKYCIILFCFIPGLIFSQNWQWTVPVSGPTYDIGKAICTDGQDYFYTASDTFLSGKISKYDGSGNLIWSKITWDGYSRSITYDNSGFVCIYGDSGNIGFLARYDTAGNRIWKINTGAGRGNGVCTDNNGSIYITGNRMIARYDVNGNLIWNHSFLYVIGKSITADQFGDCFVTGYFSDTDTFGIYPLTARGLYDIFVAKYDSNGNCLWAERAGGNRNQGIHQDIANSIILDLSGNAYVTGKFTDTADFGAFTLISQPFSDDVFISKYDPLGNLIWVRQISGPSDEEGTSVAIEVSGNILIGGMYVPPVSIGNNVLNGWGNYDAYIACYDPNGNFINVINAGGAVWNEAVAGIATDTLGNTFVTGTFYDTAYFGNQILVSGGIVDMFIAKVDLSFGAGVKENSNEMSVLVYPDPVSSIATFKINGSTETGILEIYDAHGQLILQTEAIESEINIPVSTLMSGLYFYQLKRPNANPVSGKFVVKQ